MDFWFSFVFSFNSGVETVGVVTGEAFLQMFLFDFPVFTTV